MIGILCFLLIPTGRPEANTPFPDFPGPTTYLRSDDGDEVTWEMAPVGAIRLVDPPDGLPPFLAINVPLRPDGSGVHYFETVGLRWGGSPSRVTVHGLIESPGGWRGHLRDGVLRQESHR